MNTPSFTNVFTCFESWIIVHYLSSKTSVKYTPFITKTVHSNLELYVSRVLRYGYDTDVISIEARDLEGVVDLMIPKFYYSKLGRGLFYTKCQNMIPIYLIITLQHMIL